MQHWRVEMRDLNAYRESSYASFSFVKTNSRVQLPIDTSITLAIIISTEIMVTVISPTPFVDFCFLPVPPVLRVILHSVFLVSSSSCICSLPLYDCLGLRMPSITTTVPDEGSGLANFNGGESTRYALIVVMASPAGTNSPVCTMCMYDIQPGWFTV